MRIQQRGCSDLSLAAKLFDNVLEARTEDGVAMVRVERLNG
jgi:hypothetical protein